MLINFKKKLRKQFFFTKRLYVRDFSVIAKTVLSMHNAKEDFPLFIGNFFALFDLLILKIFHLVWSFIRNSGACYISNLLYNKLYGEWTVRVPY